jgi:hypothetical protein
MPMAAVSAEVKKLAKMNSAASAGLSVSGRRLISAAPAQDALPS